MHPPPPPPPFHIIPAILHKILSHQWRLVLFAPFLPQASWYPELLQILVDHPISLPLTLLSQLNGQFLHQILQMLSRHAWILSNNQFEIDSFQRKLQITSLRQENFLLGKSMMQNGMSFPTGVVSASLSNIGDFLLFFFGPDVSLTLCCFVVYSTRRFVVCLSVCHFVLVFFSPFSIAITSLGEERANLSAFRTFVRFVLV